MKYFPKKLTMTWIRNSYKEGSLTPEELAGEIVRRAEKYRDYNIWIVAPDLKRMMGYIEKLPKDMESLPLWGIPFAVKDNIDVAGSPTTAAMQYMKSVISRMNYSVMQIMTRQNISHIAPGHIHSHRKD